MYSSSIKKAPLDSSVLTLKLYDSASKGPEGLAQELCDIFGSASIDLSERLIPWQNSLLSETELSDIRKEAPAGSSSSYYLFVHKHVLYPCIPFDHRAELVASIAFDRRAEAQLPLSNTQRHLLPHIAQALLLCHKINQQQQEIESVYQVLGHYPLPTLAVDNQVNSVFSNKLFRQLINSSITNEEFDASTSLRHLAREHIDLLKLCTRANQRIVLRNAIHDCMNATSKHSVLFKLSINEIEYPVIISTTACVPRLFRHYTRTGLAWVYFLGANYAQHLKENLRFQALKLSKAEKELSILLFEGARLSDISEHRGVSEQTVRKQLQSVLRKTRLESQEALILFLFEHCIEYGLVK